jgi:GWxTD domain-containing protein
MKRFGITSSLILLSVTPVFADLDKSAKKWLDDMRPLVLPEEAKVYRRLKNTADAVEFQKIFWARRDPDLDTSENEYQAGYLKAVAEADPKFKVAGRIGSQTDCGRVYILLGPPDSVKKETTSQVSFRPPETWTYKDRPTMKFKGGSIDIPLDGACMLPEGNRFDDQLNHIAEFKVVQTNLSYKFDAKGGLVKLADLLPKPTPVQALLRTPRTDFKMEAKPVLEIRSQDGASVFVAGLIRGDASGLTVSDAGTRKVAKVVVSVHSTDREGRVLKSQDREVAAEVAADNTFVSAFGMPLRPGEHVMKVAAIDPKSGKGSVADLTVKTQDYDAELTVSPVMILAEIVEGMTPVKDDPYFEFTFGTTKFVPRYGNVFRKAEAVTLLCAIYGAAKDEAGKISVTGGFQVLKDGKPIAKAPDETYDAEPATPSAGPVPLGTYAPGKYTAQIRLRDNVAKKDYTKETEFEIIP